MTTVFKSNVKATASVANFIGFSGPTDYNIYMDIANDLYKTKAGPTQLKNILKSPSQRKFPTIIDKLCNVVESVGGVPRRSYVPLHGIFAVMSETSNAGYIAGNNITITTNPTTVYALYATKGSINIDNTKVNVLAGSCTVLDPFLLKYKADTTIGFTKTRFDAQAVCIACVGNRVPLSIVKDRDTVADSDLIVDLSSVNKMAFTVVIRTISPKSGRGVLPAAVGYVPIIKMFQDANTNISYVKVRNTSLNIRTKNSGVAQVAEEAALVTQEVDTYAISVGDGAIKHYMNGAKVNAPAHIQLPSFTLNEMRILSLDGDWGVPKECDALVNLIIYDRVLSDEELSKCIFS